MKHISWLGNVKPWQWEVSRHLYDMFPLMVQKVPPCRCGAVEFKHCAWTPQQAYVVGTLRNELRTTHPTLQMNIDGVGWMFDTLHERWMNRTTVINAAGDVLIGGLGMGMILWPILAKRNVRSVTVIENNPSVPELVLPTLERAKGIEKLQVVQADARDWKPARGQLFDYIWLDCVPAYGYGLKFLELHHGWLDRYTKFHRCGASSRQAWLVDHWGYQENLLHCLHFGTDPEDWPEDDQRPYPIGLPDPAVALLAESMGKDGTSQLCEATGMTRDELMASMMVGAVA